MVPLSSDRSTPLLAAQGLGKRYGSASRSLRRFARILRTGVGSTGSESWAVRDVSLRLGRGRCLGLIGRNGAGKSTLLRLLAGVAQPSAGRLEVNAPLGCLLDLGVGFHPMETGRENAEAWLVLVGGRSRAEARAEAQRVAEFADIGDYFDRPLRTFSAGMSLRVAFAVQTVLEPEVWITDEVLAVGDDGFQRKCNSFFDGFLGRGGSLVLCSHDLSQIQRLCQDSLWLDHGVTAAMGPTTEVIAAYRQSLTDRVVETRGVHHRLGEKTGLAFEVVGLAVRGADDPKPETIRSGGTLIVDAEVFGSGRVPTVVVGICHRDGSCIYGLTSDMDGVSPLPCGEDRYRFRVSFFELPLMPGEYLVRAHAMDDSATRLYDSVEAPFRVVGEVCKSSLGAGVGAGVEARQGFLHLRTQWTDDALVPVSEAIATGSE